MHTITEFFDRYSLVNNPFAADNQNSPLALFENSKEELEFLANYALTSEKKIWTVFQYDNCLIIKAGLSYSTRLGHLITNEPYAYRNEEYVDMYDSNPAYAEEIEEVYEDIGYVA